MRIGIIGAGHAGVEAARAATDRGADVVLFSDESVPPYYRPRVVALAFHQIELDAISMRPGEWYEKNRIDLRLDSPATDLDVQKKTVVAAGKSETFDALIIAVGAGPVLLPFVPDFPDDVIPLWDVRRSLAIQKKLQTARRLVIIGGGISGVEAALYGRAVGLDVTVVEKANRLMSLQFGEKAAAGLARCLQERGVELLTDCYVTSVARSKQELQMTLDNEQTIPCDLAVTTVGATCDVTLFERAGLHTDRGILADDCLRTSAPNIFACGDVAQRDGIRTANVMRAAQHGRSAGSNAVACLEGNEPDIVPEPVVPLSFKHEGIEFYAAGPATGENLEEKILTDDGAAVYRSVLLENGTLRGVQMLGTHEDLQRLVRRIGQPWQDTQA